MKDLVRAFKALADETRLRILALLAERECCVCEVTQALNISQTRASRNLGELYDAGFLKFRKQGSWSLYTIDKEGLDGMALSLINIISRTLQSNPVILADHENLEKASRPGMACGQTLAGNPRPAAS